jgi:hypothetical protein
VRFARLFLFCLLSCGSRDGDPPVNNGIPPAEGKDLRIRDVTDPSSDQKAQHLEIVSVSGVRVIAVDQHDETRDGRSRGTIYVQDLSPDPKVGYAGTSLFAPEFVPGNLKVGPGDVLDMRGTYQQNQGLGTTVTFAPGATLDQIARPVARFRYEDKPAQPVLIDVNDLSDYATGRRWLNMLVKVENVEIRGALVKAMSGRASAEITPGGTGGQIACEQPFPKPATITNELTDLESLDIRARTNVKSITGIVTYFCNLHLSPRSPADVEK